MQGPQVVFKPGDDVRVMDVNSIYHGRLGKVIDTAFVADGQNCEVEVAGHGAREVVNAKALVKIEPVPPPLHADTVQAAVSYEREYAEPKVESPIEVKANRDEESRAQIERELKDFYARVAETDTVPEVSRLVVGKGDVLVAHLPDELIGNNEETRKYIQSRLPEGVQVLVLPQSVKLLVLGSDGKL